MTPTSSWRSYLTLTLAGLLPLFLGSCAIFQAKLDGEDMSVVVRPVQDKSKPHASSKPVGPEFQKIALENRLPSSLLRPPGGPYRVGPGDELDIEIAEKSETRALSRVMPDGMLYYDVAGGVNVKGRTISDVSRMLSAELSRNYIDPIVTVNVANADSQRYWILGDVRQPGAFPLKRPTTLIAALSQTNGLGSSVTEGDATDTVDLERAILIRDKQLVPVDFKALIECGDMSQNVYVQSGDYIYLPSKQPRSIYVLGAVNSPGPVFYDSCATLLTSVASAGGPRPDAVVTKVLLLRGGTREPQVCVVNLNHLLTRSFPDVKVEGGDIIWVPKSPWTNLKRYTQSVVTTASQAIAVQEGLGILGSSGGAGVTITAGGGG